MKTTTITREYDEHGRMVREIRVEVERPDVTVTPNQWWQPQPGWWQNPVISYGGSVTKADTTTYLIN